MASDSFNLIAIVGALALAVWVWHKRSKGEHSIFDRRKANFARRYYYG